VRKHEACVFFRPELCLAEAGPFSRKPPASTQLPGGACLAPTIPTVRTLNGSAPTGALSCLKRPVAASHCTWPPLYERTSVRPALQPTVHDAPPARAVHVGATRPVFVVLSAAHPHVGVADQVLWRRAC
jgi:hypothetical protein